jgi:hypothetical protein
MESRKKAPVDGDACESKDVEINTIRQMIYVSRDVSQITKDTFSIEIRFSLKQIQV